MQDAPPVTTFACNIVPLPEFDFMFPQAHYLKMVRRANLGDPVDVVVVHGAHRRRIELLGRPLSLQ